MQVISSTNAGLQLRNKTVNKTPASFLQTIIIYTFRLISVARNLIIFNLEYSSLFEMKLPLRIAILECDRPLDKTREQYGRYGGVFRQLLERAADALNYPGLDSKNGLEISYWAVEKDSEFPNLEDIDAIMMTG